MSCDYFQLAVAGVRDLSPYKPGKPIEELQRELGIDSVVKLASNENPLGPSARVLQAIDRVKLDLCRYPDGNGFVLKQALASHLGVEMNQITLGNGSNDVLELIARAFLGVGDEAIYSQYAFAVYPLATQAAGATGVVTPALDWGHDLSAMAAAVTDKTKVIFIANPNNPTGTWFGKATWEAFMAKVPERVVVVLDEAYIEYVANNELDGVKYLAQFPNLVITRTFSKAYGLAALRVGYSISNGQIADILNRVRQPFNVDTFALAAATAVLKDEEYIDLSRAVNESGLRQLEAGVSAIGLEYIPSKGNFLTVHFQQPGEQVYLKLLHQGVIVRPVANYGMPNSLRISVGLEAENQRFLDALPLVLSAHD